jgi:hypothetical protein
MRTEKAGRREKSKAEREKRGERRRLNTLTNVIVASFGC